MTYQEKIKEGMTWLGKQEKSVFLGEGLINAGRIYSTLSSVPLRKCIEFPVAENLIVGSAIGLALEGYRPIVVFQRHDFLLLAADQIINHLALLPSMSGNQFQLPVIIRAIIGSRSSKFNVGPQHQHDFTHIFKPYIRTWIIKDWKAAVTGYANAYDLNEPVLIVEDRDDYDKTT